MNASCLACSRLRLTVAGAVVVAVIAGATLQSTLISPAFGQNAERTPPVPPEQLQHAMALSEVFRAVSRSMSPSVVNIISIQRAESPQIRTPDGQPLDEDMFRRFFDIPEGAPLQPGPQSPQQRMGNGSGVIVRQDGYIITNNHVVEGATEIKVRLTGDVEYDATVVGTDPETDLAVIRIEASGLTAADFGNSDQMEVGDWVLALGSPFGYEHSVTAGIVSAKGRKVGIIRDARGFSGFEDFIQTDAAINPGNSGGPLVNLHGEVIGISTAISTRTGGNVGIGFAIPSNMVQPVMESIIETGTVRRGALGVGIQPLTPAHSEYHGYEGSTGAVVSQVYPESAAERAGIQDGDIITTINGQPIADTAMLMNTVARRAPGDSVEVEIFRKGERKTVEVVLGDRTAQFAAAPNERGGQNAETSAGRDLGMTVQNLTPAIAQQLNAEGRRGVVVTQVQPDSIASEAGLIRGDIIARVDDAPVRNVDQFNRLLEQGDLDRGVALQVFNNNVARIVILKNVDD